MVTIELSNRINLKEILSKHQLDSYQIVNYSIGNDDQIYLLMAKNIPDRIDGMFVPTISNTNYKALVLTVDWYSGELIHTNVIDFGVIKPNIHFLQPIGDNYLLLGARASLYKDGTTDKNAIIIDATGNIIRTMCLGDGIQDCLVDSQNRIITSYFDEGIFGNNGWSRPIGESGIIQWSETGDILWKNWRYDICDCCAMNLDSNDNLWFYYYTNFDLVKTDYTTDIVYTPKIEGSSGFLLNRQQNAILFDQGYNHHGKFCVLTLANHTLGEIKQCCLEYNGEKLDDLGFSFRNSKAIFLDNDQMYYLDWI